MTNLDKLQTLSAAEMSYFILYGAPQVYRNYTSSLLGFEDWLSQPVDENFWDVIHRNYYYLERSD